MCLEISWICAFQSMSTRKTVSAFVTFSVVPLVVQVHDPDRALLLWATLALAVCYCNSEWFRTETSAKDKTVYCVQKQIYLIRWFTLTENITDTATRQQTFSAKAFHLKPSWGIDSLTDNFPPWWRHSWWVLICLSCTIWSVPDSVATPLLALLKESFSVCYSVEGRVPTVMWYARCSASTPGPVPTLTTHCTTGGSTFLTVVRFSRCFKLCSTEDKNAAHFNTIQLIFLN